MKLNILLTKVILTDPFTNAISIDLSIIRNHIIKSSACLYVCPANLLVINLLVISAMTMSMWLLTGVHVRLHTHLIIDKYNIRGRL